MGVDKVERESMVEPVGYIGLIITKKHWCLGRDGDVTWLEPGDCLTVPVYETDYADSVFNKRSVAYVKQMANDGYVRYATDEEMKDADMTPTEVKHVYKNKEDNNAKETKR